MKNRLTKWIAGMGIMAVVLAAPMGQVFAEPQNNPEMVVVNVNTANSEELQKVRGIGPFLAERILEYREMNGPFQSPDDLANVRGIGGAKLQKIKNQIIL